MNKIQEKNPRQGSIGGTRIGNGSVVNVAHEEKQEGCISEYKHEQTDV